MKLNGNHCYQNALLHRDHCSASLQAPKPQLSKFCRKCGGKISMRRPPTENELRHVCDTCGYIDYYNPKLVRSVRLPFVVLQLSTHHAAAYMQTFQTMCERPSDFVSCAWPSSAYTFSPTHLSKSSTKGANSESYRYQEVA